MKKICTWQWWYIKSDESTKHPCLVSIFLFQFIHRAYNLSKLLINISRCVINSIRLFCHKIFFESILTWLRMVDEFCGSPLQTFFMGKPGLKHHIMSVTSLLIRDLLSFRKCPFTNSSKFHSKRNAVYSIKFLSSLEIQIVRVEAQSRLGK